MLLVVLMAVSLTSFVPSTSDRSEAFLLISAPADADIPEYDEASVIRLRYTLALMASELEVAGTDMRRGSLFGIQSRSEFDRDVRFVRSRYWYVRDFPGVCEAERFPSADYLRDAVARNRSVYNNLVGRLPWEQDRADVLLPMIAETDRLHRLYCSLVEARNTNHSPHYRRANLAKVKAMLGDWDTVPLPDCVPAGSY